MIDRLLYLHKMQIIDYLPRTDSPQLHYLQPRMDSQHLHIDALFINIRKKIKENKLQAVFDYLSSQQCRSQLLLAYFDETGSEACGECDVCLRKNRKNPTDPEMKTALDKALALGPLALRDLVDHMDAGDEEQRLVFLRKCLDEGLLEDRDGLLYRVS